MNKRQKKKDFRKAVYEMPQGRRSKAGTWLKKETRKWEKEILASDEILWRHRGLTI